MTRFLAAALIALLLAQGASGQTLQQRIDAAEAG